jgi:hypothetical protein
MKDRFQRRATIFLAALLLLAESGCLSFVNPVEPATKEQLALCKQLPDYCRNRVYIFFLQGIDPLGCANFQGLHDHVRSVGFIKTYYGYPYHIFYFRNEMARIHKKEPDARFVVIGFNVAANLARDLAELAHEDDVPIDLLVYLGSHTLTNCPENRPDHVLRVLNIQGCGWLAEGDSIDGAENVHLGDAWHFGSPGHLHTRNLLEEELVQVACRVPYVQRKPVLQWEEQAPAPTPLPGGKPGPRDKWDFLEPTDELPPPRVLPKGDARGPNQP